MMTEVAGRMELDADQRLLEDLPGDAAAERELDLDENLESSSSGPAGGNAIAASEARADDETAVQASGMAGEDEPAHIVPLAMQGVANTDAPLPHLERIQMAFGAHDLSDVRVTEMSHAADQLGANAYTLGDRIAFRHSPDLRLAAHEAAHVVQQRRGVQLEGRIGRAGDRYERLADEVADAVVAGRSATSMLGPVGHRAAAQGPAIQYAPKPAKDAKPAHLLSTATLLELSLTRLDDIAQNGDGYAKIATSDVAESVRAALDGRAPDAPDKLREKAIRLNSFLAANQTVFRAFPPMENKAAYLPGIADHIVEAVRKVSRKYAVSLQLAWRADADRAIYEMAIDQADKAMGELPNYIVWEYLSPEGIEREIKKIKPELDKLDELRRQVHRAPVRGRPAETIVWMHAPPSFRDAAAKDLADKLKFARDERTAGHDITNQLKAVNLLTEQALGVIYAMQVYEQLDAYVQELDNWINKGIEIFWKDILGRMRGYRGQVDDILKIFEADISDPKVGFGGASTTRVHDGLNKLMKLVNSDEFKAAVGLAEERMKTIAVIRLVGKAIALTALAALGGAVAAEFAGAGALALGAAEGGAVARGAAFVGEVLAFTAIQRTGQQAIFGGVEGSFWSDAFVNALTFGALKAGQTVFTRAFKIFADPKVWKTTYALGKAGAGLFTLELFAEAHYALTHKGAVMPGEERVRGLIQNVVLIVALEAGRFITEPIALRLSMPALRFKLGKRMEALDASYASVAAGYEKLKRGELSNDEVLALTAAIAKQWFEELKLLADAERKKVITEAELKTAVAKYQRAIAELELQLSRINVEAPHLGQASMFRTLDTGVVQFDGKSDAIEILKKFYKDKGGTFEPSKTLKDGFEGRLPDGELTFYVPDGVTPKGIPGAAKLAAARDAANKASAEDAMAADGLARLASVFGKLRVDEILAGVPPDTMTQFLRMFADPGMSTGDARSAGAAFFANVAGSKQAIRFGRRYGIKLVINLARRFKWTPALEKAFDDIDIRAQADPEGTKSWLADLERAKTLDEVEQLLGKEKAKPLPKKPVRATKRALPVVRGDEWETQRREVDQDAKHHGQTLSGEELDLRTDCEAFFAQAKAGRYRRFGRTSKLKFLDAFDDVAKRSQMPQNWINAHRGSLSEALFNPQFGIPKSRFLGGQLVAGKTPTGATIPDYTVPHTGFTEYVNQKSDLIDRGTRDTQGAFDAGKTAARTYLAKAKGSATQPGEAINLPSKDRYSLDFVRDPGAATQKAMLAILFGDGSPIFRVKFGDGPWHQNPNIK